MQDDEETKSDCFWLNPYQLKYDHRWTRVAADFVSSLVNQEAITVAVEVEVQVCVFVCCCCFFFNRYFSLHHFFLMRKREGYWLLKEHFTCCNIWTSKELGWQCLQARNIATFTM